MGSPGVRLMRLSVLNLCMMGSTSLLARNLVPLIFWYCGIARRYMRSTCRHVACGVLDQVLVRASC